MAKADILQELNTLKTLLKQEKEEDLLQYKLRITGTSPVERRNQGVCWYPVHLDKTEFDAGERLIVRVTRPKEHKHTHLFQSGKLVSVFDNTNSKNSEEESVNGVVNFVKDHEMVVTINGDEFPDWLFGKNIGVQLLFDENSYKEMEYALHFVTTTKVERINQLMHIILGDAEAQFSQENPIILPWLNQSQNDALNIVINAKDIAIVHGPPGTGKTTTLIEAILQTLKNESQILVCAPSNAAVDLLVEKLYAKGVNVVRLGHPARVNEEILSKTLDARISQHLNYKDLKSSRKKSQEYFNLAGKYKRNFGPEEREQRKLLFDEAHRLKREAEQLEFYITKDIIENAQVIACTLVGASNMAIKGRRFKTVFMDEAAQALEPASWIPILKSDRVVFAGDHCQLPPTIKSLAAAKGGLEKTLFEKAIQRNKADTMLKEQYRMNKLIMGFSGSFFYKNQLIANTKVADWKIFDDDSPVEFIDTAGCGFYEQVDLETKSSFNPEEAELLIKHLGMYLTDLEYKGLLEKVDNIGIISPYSAQTIYLKSRILDDGLFPDETKVKFSINTVDSFQGQERDIIYISLVRSNEKSEIGFLADIRRMNVAITRARKKLVVIGDSGTISRNPFYAQFVEYVTEKGAYKSAFEYLY